jgi:predicted permease
MNFAWRIYRWLARAFPHEFQLTYGREVTQLGKDVIEDFAGRRGVSGLVGLIADTAVRVPLEYLSEMRRDMRYGLRALIKSPGFALVGVTSMGVAVALTLNLYGSELQLVFRALPAAANVKRLVMAQHPVSYYYVEQYRDQRGLFAGVAALQNDVPFNVTFPGETNAKPERVFGQLVSPDYFSVLGVQPQHGQLFSGALSMAGAAAVVVISDAFWRHRLNSAPSAVGQTLHLNGQPAIIVGITPRNFNGAASENPSELFVPITVPAALAPELADDVLHRRDAKEFLAIMCLQPGITVDSAEAGLDTITRRLDGQVSALAPVEKGRRVTLLPAGTVVPLPRQLRPVIIGFFVVLMGLVVTIACMNLSSMLLARAAYRRKELAIRLSVGASRFRLVRQMISEGLLLSLLGGLAGFALAYWLSVLDSRVNPSTGRPPGPDLTLDWHAAVLAFILAIVGGIGLSLVPALQATKADLTPALRDGWALRLPGYRRFGLRNLLMVAQVAASLMLLLITGFLLAGISRVSTVQTKFDPHTMYLVSIDPVRDGYTPRKAQALWEKLFERLKAVGSVRSVTLAVQPPFANEGAKIELTAEDSHVQKQAVEETVGAGYFAALSESMLAGSEFVDLDQRTHAGALRNSSLPVVLNESAARGFFGKQNAIGRRLRDDRRSYEVIGVVRDLKNGIGVWQSVIYLPLTTRDFLRPPAGGLTIMVRSDGGADPRNVVQREVTSIDPNLTLFNAQNLSQFLDYSQSDLRFALRTYGSIGVFGLVLAAIGLAGVTAYAVAQRRKEIGIRTAVGASKGQVLRLVLREGTALTFVGTVLGFLGAFAMVKILSAMANILVDAFRVGTDDPRLLVGAPFLLASVAMIACYLPASRLAHVDPLKALREE